MARNRRFLANIEVRELGRACRVYTATRARTLGRDMFRFTADAAPRYECKRCKHGFRLPSQLRDHLRANKRAMFESQRCVLEMSPVRTGGTEAYQADKELCEEPGFPRV